MDSQQSQQQEALRMQQHAEALLRSQAEAALRLAMSQALPQLNQQDNNNPFRHNGNYQSHQGQPSQQLSPDITEALRLQEQRLEQALRLHGSDPRSLGFSLSGQQQNQNQPWNFSYYWTCLTLNIEIYVYLYKYVCIYVYEGMYIYLHRFISVVIVFCILLSRVTFLPFFSGVIVVFIHGWCFLTCRWNYVFDLSHFDSCKGAVQRETRNSRKIDK